MFDSPFIDVLVSLSSASLIHHSFLTFAALDVVETKKTLFSKFMVVVVAVGARGSLDMLLFSEVSSRTDKNNKKSSTSRRCRR